MLWLFRLLMFVVAFVAVSADSIKYSYDAAGRLVKADYGAAGVINYTYDKAGNLLTRQVQTSGGPVITGVVNAFGNSTTLSPNTWTSVKGSGFSATTRNWLGPDFVNNQMPIALDGVSVTMNGKNCYVYYVSDTFLNVLTPPDLATGQVQTVVTTGGKASAAFTSQAQPLSPSFFVFDGVHITGTHVDASLLGPTTLYPGFSTPAKPGETLIVYGNGFGPTSVPVVTGSVVQSGVLAPRPVVKIGNNIADVTFAGLVAPGEFQFNIVAPASTPDGEIPVTATYSGLTTPVAILAVQH